MASITARGAASVDAMGGFSGNGGSARDHINASTPAGWALGWWGLSVLIIFLLLWAM